MKTKSTAGRNLRLRRKQELQGMWFRPGHFEKRQPYNTFLSPHRRKENDPDPVAMVIRHLRPLVPHPEKASALEIGPGDAPVISTLPFRRRVFLDQSHRILKGLPSDSHRVVGDFRHIPIAGHFDVAVVNEVLTHLTPRDRLAAIRKLIQHADSVLLIDRPSRSLQDVRRALIAQRILTRGHLQQNKQLEQLLPGAVLVPSVEELQERYNQLRRKKNKQELRLVQRELVHFPAITRLFIEKGWEVNTVTTDEKEGYVILTAHKKK